MVRKIHPHMQYSDDFNLVMVKLIKVNLTSFIVFFYKLVILDSNKLKHEIL